ncbi:PucR family transcriptional regulator [Amycolatopsis pithecellobii]|nr:helix-turn-helix domain-containing protein [Amycolatopsis pithecellobii]
MSPVAALLNEMLEDVDELACRIVERVRREIRGYAQVPEEEHREQVHAHLLEILAGLRDRVPPSPAMVNRVRALGRRRAAQRINLPDLVEACQVVYQEIWNELLVRATHHEPDLSAQLLGEVAPLWSSSHRVTNAAASAHAIEQRSATTTRVALRRQFLDTLRTPVDVAEGRRVARALDFDPNTGFVALCTTLTGLGDIDRLDAALAESGLPALVTDDGAVTVMIGQGTDETLLTALRSVSPDAPAGIGLSRPGIEGAAVSVVDARDSLEAALRLRRDVRFAEDWLQVLLHTFRHRLRPIMRHGRDVALDNPALADAVRAFARAGFSLAESGRRLQISPNTLAYRLERWRTLTGWDVRTFRSLVASLASIDWAHSPETPSTNPRIS